MDDSVKRSPGFLDADAANGALRIVLINSNRFPITKRIMLERDPLTPLLKMEWDSRGIALITKRTEPIWM